MSNEYFIENTHVWKRGQTNEYCVHCGLIFESDLGWTSADGIKCIERKNKIEDLNFEHMPENIKSYARFRGLIWNKQEKRFVKSFQSETYTIKQILKIIEKLK